MDFRVLETQQWLNQTYGNNPNFVKVDEDGVTGISTVKGLIRGLQIEIGELPADGVFGNETANKFNTMFPNGLSQTTDDSSQSVKNVVYILQGGFFCRGIDPKGLTGFFGPNTAASVKEFQMEAGISQDGIVTAKIMRAILTTDAFTLVKNGDPKIREIQQALNLKYGAYMNLIPTNGLIDRKLAKGLIVGLQKEIGVDADGIWGPGTLNACPTLQRGSTKKNLVYILQYALYVNGFDPNGFDGGYGNGVVKAVTDFQDFTMLDADGICGKQTWASLLISYGDKNRQTSVCDTRFEITTERAKILKNNGYHTVGRYLTGGDFKELRDGELERIIDEGLDMFPIFQENGRQASDFSEDIGKEHAKKAIEAAIKKEIPNNTIIYFAVDYDVLEPEIASNIIPYFRGLNDIFDTLSINDFNYKIGVYGPRQVCSEVSKKYAVSSFVSDMSSGFSGNIGHKLPENWNLDQIANITISDPTYGSLEIDKDIYSHKYGLVHYYNTNNYIYWQIKQLYNLAYKKKNNIKEANRLVLDFLRGKYVGPAWDQISGIVDFEFINEVKNTYPYMKPENMNIDCGDISINVQHLAVTIESYIVNVVSVIEEVQAYAGWAGDLCQLGAKLQEQYDHTINKHVYSDTQVSTLVGATDKEAKALGFSSAEATGFPLEDLYQDLDGLIIGTDGIKTTPIHELFKTYYLEGLYTRRANLFYTALDKTGISFSDPTDVIATIAKKYTYNPLIFSQIFGAIFGSFDEKLFGDVLAYGFAIKIEKLMVK